jgi:hypothetical protein
LAEPLVQIRPPQPSEFVIFVVTGNPPYGMIGGTVETAASFEARFVPRSYPTAGGDQR